MKKCKTCWEYFEKENMKTQNRCFWCDFQKTKSQKWLKKIGKRKSKERWQEAKLFKKVWNTRTHICEVCWCYIPEARTYCFAHKLPKGMYPEYKYNIHNIALVCSIECHQELDKKNAGNKQALIDNMQ